MLPRPRTVLLIALILAAEHHYGDSLCLQVRLNKFINRYNKVQDNYPECCEGGGVNLPNACLYSDKCDHAFRVELSTYGNVVNSGWSGTEWYSPVIFGDTIKNIKNQFKHCQKIERVTTLTKEGNLEDGDRPKPVKVLVHVVDEDDCPNDDDLVAIFEVYIDLYKTGLEYKRIAAWSMWKRQRHIRNKEADAPYYLEFEAKVIVEDRDPPHFSEAWIWDAGDDSLCSTHDSTLTNCRQLSGGGASRRTEGASTAPLPAPPPAATLALLLLAARASAL